MDKEHRVVIPFCIALTSTENQNSGCFTAGISSLTYSSIDNLESVHGHASIVIELIDTYTHESFKLLYIYEIILELSPRRKPILLHR